MTITSKSARLLSAAIGATALVISAGAFALTDDSGTMPVGGGPIGSGGVPGSSGVPGGSGTVQSPSAGAPSAAQPPSGRIACTPMECQGTAEPTTPAHDVPFPPGAVEPRWNQPTCAGINSGKVTRMVRGNAEQVRDWYLKDITASGWGWGVGGTVEPSLWTEHDDGSRTMLNWAGTLSVQGNSVRGDLDVEGFRKSQRSCGPAKGEVYIAVRTW